MKAVVVCSNKTSKKRSTQPYLYVQLAYYIAPSVIVDAVSSYKKRA
jgi:hypothetical protein